MKTNFRISNLDCEACIKLSTLALKEIPGIENIEIHLQTGEASIEAPETITFEQIKDTLQKIGKNAEQISK